MNERERAITCQVEVPAPIKEVWKAWTTEKGLTSFMAPAARVEARPNGAFEPLFNIKAPPGQQGAEGMKIMALQPPTFLSFTWNAPPHLPEVRNQTSHVSVRLVETATDKTRVTLWHDGWGIGGEWDEAFAYFSRAWPKIVLPRLLYRFRVGPVDWHNPPSFDSGSPTT